MKKILFFAFLVLSVLLMVPKYAPAPGSYQSTDLEKVVDGDTTAYYFDGVLTYASDLHYARMVRTKSGNRILDQFYDETGKPAKQSAGHYALLRVYDGNNEISRTYLDENLQPMKNTTGYSTRERVIRDGHVEEEWYKDTGGAPAVINSGICGKLSVWENGRNTVITYVDADGNPKENSSGYAIIKRSYYEEAPWKGKVESESYYDAAGAPVSLSNGQYGMHKEYDGQGRLIRTDYFNADGSILYSVVRSYKPDNSAAGDEYYDAGGKPLRQIAGHYRIRNSEGKTIYLQSDRKSLNRFLHDEPLVVICVGALILALSSAATKRANFFLLVLYLGFVFYMTLWERDGEPRARFELFWSYKQFFTSSSLRLEIMYNIWLFIPLGGILAKLGLGRKSVLVCLLASVCIETVQLFTGLGLAELDDVISNTLGGTIGMWLSKAAHL